MTKVGGSRKCHLRRCLASSEWNVEGGRQCVVWLDFFFFFFFFLLLDLVIFCLDCWVDG